jgi:hypothetical protein
MAPNIDNWTVLNHTGSPYDAHRPYCPHANVCPHCGAPKAGVSPWYPYTNPYTNPYVRPTYPWTWMLVPDNQTAPLPKVWY